MNKVTPIDSEQSAIAIVNYPSIHEVSILPPNETIQICKICLEE